MSYIIFKGIHSDVMSVRITALPPLIRAPERVEMVPIPGRSGALTLLGGQRKVYDSFKQLLEGVMLPNADADDVRAWLSGAGELICNGVGEKDQNTERMQRVRVIEMVTLERLLRGRTYRSFDVKFECQPYYYEARPASHTLTGAATLNNPGTEWSQPVITVRGSGNITLTIEGAYEGKPTTQEIQLLGISGSITIDSEMQDAYNDTALLNTQMMGDFPVFEPGANRISWSGTVSEVIVRPHWRWI